jgi:hypothetical protein
MSPTLGSDELSEPLPQAVKPNTVNRQAIKVIFVFMLFSKDICF